jgi:RHS repeat-associated protein
MKQLSTSPTITSNLTYDSGDQLTQVVNTTPGNPSTTFNYGYDPAGNRTSDNTGTYTINDVNEITNTGYSYDANGNLTGDGLRTYQWDAANRLIGIYPGTAGSTVLTCDGLGRRVAIVEKNGSGNVQKTSNFVWSGMTVAEERNSSNTVVKRFLGEGVQLPTGTSPNTKLYYSKDHLGSTRSLTNENGTILGTLDYDAYGGISRAPVPANDTSGSGPVLTSAVSRLTHGGAGTFNVSLPLNGAPGIEMRSGGNYTLVLTFDRNVLSDTSTTIASGIGTVGTTVFLGNTATISLSGVSDRQTITVELDNVVGVTGINSKVLVSMSVLVCDVNQSGAVTVEDMALIQANSGMAVTNSTFKYDTNHNGLINSTDASIAFQSLSQGDSLYPDFVFTGHYYHARSGLYLTMYRAYSPTLGRWLSRDPIGEGKRGDVNLYAYVENNAVNGIDLFGLKDYSAAETQALIDQAVHRVTSSWNPFARALALYNLHGTKGDLDFLLTQHLDTFCVDGQQLNSDDFGNYLAGYDSQAALSFIGDDIVRLVALGYASINATTGRIDFSQRYLNQGIYDATLKYGIFGRFGH